MRGAALLQSERAEEVNVTDILNAQSPFKMLMHRCLQVFNILCVALFG